jgi:hypothetical protein
MQKFWVSVAELGGSSGNFYSGSKKRPVQILTMTSTTLTEVFRGFSQFLEANGWNSTLTRIWPLPFLSLPVPFSTVTQSIYAALYGFQHIKLNKNSSESVGVQQHTHMLGEASGGLVSDVVQAKGFSVIAPAPDTYQLSFVHLLLTSRHLLGLPWRFI